MVEGGAVVLGGPESSCRFVGQGHGGLVVADALRRVVLADPMQSLEALLAYRKFKHPFRPV